MLREMTSTAGRFGVYEVLKTRLAPEGEPTANLGAARTVRLCAVPRRVQMPCQR